MGTTTSREGELTPPNRELVEVGDLPAIKHVIQESGNDKVLLMIY